jgi:acyl-CoA synthetase (AMP-forming)/AMP-acid ligase II
MTAIVPTVATRIRERAQSTPRAVAFREKSLGIWQETTWAEYADLVERAAHGLLALGARLGDHVAIECDNRAEWLVAEAGAVAVPPNPRERAAALCEVPQTASQTSRSCAPGLPGGDVVFSRRLASDWQSSDRQNGILTAVRLVT